MAIELAFAKVLQRLRRERKISQEQFALSVGVHRTYISQLERGIGNPSLQVMYKIAKALNITLTYLVSLIEQENID